MDPGTYFTGGDYAIAVKWWVKTSDDPEDRTYEEEQPSIEDVESYGIEKEHGAYLLIINSIEFR